LGQLILLKFTAGHIMSQGRVLVTGGAGLLGSHLCELLLENNFSVVCVDNFITGRKENLTGVLENPAFELIEADASQPPESYLGQEGDFDYIYHLASPASPKGYQKNPVLTYKVNGFGTHFLLEYARKTGARFLYTSTSEAYGDPLEHPQVEGYWGNVNPIGVRACYDVSKRFGEMACITAVREHDQDVRWVRIFNTYGSRNDPYDGRVIPSFIMNALKNEPIVVYGDGSHTRSYCYVSDLVNGLYKMMMSDRVKGEVINLGNPDEYTVLQTAEVIREVIGSSSEIVFEPLSGVRSEDPKKRQPDISKARELLGWEPVVEFRKGLVPTVEYFKKILVQS
jgi:nucleoside-diphosphate-sugar epimerase